MKSRRNNLRFDALSQAQDEELHSSEVKIEELVKEKFGIENIEMKSAHKVKKVKRNDASQKRTIIAKTSNYKDHEIVLQEYRSCKLWKEGVHINENNGTQKISNK